ncbi:hypothetical protein [Lactobacillus taiwanensis]|uniref:hypothetical protein n=1 Tax=Lactobacillus taiwanensis TaxID=508451 RepID=UPI00242CCC9D|nr:hypothetical protein [Lactobacillus taiwanensis]
MIKVLAKNKEQYIIAIDYRLYSVDKNNNVYSISSIKSSLRLDNFKYGDFTSEYSEEKLQSIRIKTKKFDPEFDQYKKDVMEDSNMTEDQFNLFVKKGYEQDLASFNEIYGKEIFHNMKVDSAWVNKYLDYL